MPRTYTGTQGRVDQRRNRLDPEDEESDEEFDAAQTQAQTQGRAGLSDNVRVRSVASGRLQVLLC